MRRGVCVQVLQHQWEQEAGVQGAGGAIYMQVGALAWSAWQNIAWAAWGGEEMG